MAARGRKLASRITGTIQAQNSWMESAGHRHSTEQPLGYSLGVVARAWISAL